MMLLPIVIASASLIPKQLPGARLVMAHAFARMAALMLLLALCGCGGGSHGGKKTGKGAAVFTITWPRVEKSTRLIPATATLIRIKITQTTNTVTTSYGSQDAVRPPVNGQPPITTPTTTVVFNNLPPGQFSATATAYPSNPDAPPPTPIIAQAMATVPLTIANGQTTTSNLTMDTTIMHVLGTIVTQPASPTPVFILPGSSQATRGFTPFIFMPQAKDTPGLTPGNTVLIASNTLQVTTSDIAIARVSPLPNSQFAISNAGKLGTVTVTVREPDSGFAQSFSLLFLPAYIYVADSNNNRLVRIDDITQSATNANFHTYGGYGTGDVQFNYPQQLTVDSLNRVYVADTGNDRLARIDDITDMSAAGFKSYGMTGSGLNEFINPYGVAMDAMGHFYIADSGNQRVVRIDSFNNDFTANGFLPFGTYGNNNSNQFGGPIEVAVDSLGRIYVTDPFNNRIVRMNDISGGGFTPYSGNGSDTLNGPYGIAVDAQDRIYIADTTNSRIVRINDISGAGFTTYDASNSGMGRLAFPVGIAFDPQNHIYIVDSSNNRIVRIDDMTGANFIAYGTFGDVLQGPALGQFNFPYSIAVH